MYWHLWQFVPGGNLLVIELKAAMILVAHIYKIKVALDLWIPLAIVSSKVKKWIPYIQNYPNWGLL